MVLFSLVAFSGHVRENSAVDVNRRVGRIAKSIVFMVNVIRGVGHIARVMSFRGLFYWRVGRVVEMVGSFGGRY